MPIYRFQTESRISVNIQAETDWYDNCFMDNMTHNITILAVCQTLFQEWNKLRKFPKLTVIADFYTFEPPNKRKSVLSSKTNFIL